MSNQCKDCDKEISPRAKRCYSCATKARWERGDFNDVYDAPEYRRKNSESRKAAHARGVYNNPKTRKRRSESLKVAHARGDFNGQSKAIKAAWIRGAYGPEVQRKKSESLKTVHACGVYGPETRRKQSESQRAAWARGDFDGIYQSPTSIELAIAAALDICGIEHISQYRPGGYSRIYDEFVPPNLLIEVHGDYWHGPERPENQKRDGQKAAWAKQAGYILVVIWQHEIKKQGAWALIYERILPLLEKRCP